MKQTFLYVIISLILLSACNKDYNNNCFDKQGEISTEVRILEEFENIIIWGVFDIFLKQDTTNYVIVETNENLFPFIETSIENNTLNLYDNVNCKWSRKYYNTKMTIHFKNLSFIKNNVTCNINSIDTIFSNDIYIYARSELAEMNLILIVDRFQFSGSHTTSGKYYFSGKCNNFVVRAFSAIQIYAQSLQTENAYIYQHSIGDIFADVRLSLDAYFYNSGDIYLKQSPEKVTIKEQSGNGKVIY